MDPIVVRGPLEWFPGVDGAIHLFLLLAVKVRSFPSLLNLQAFSLTILLRHLLFVMCYFRLFHEIMFCVFNGTKNTLVMDRDLWVFIVCTHVTSPFPGVSIIHDTIAIAVYRQAAFAARQVLVSLRFQLATDCTRQHKRFGDIGDCKVFHTLVLLLGSGRAGCTSSIRVTIIHIFVRSCAFKLLPWRFLYGGNGWGR